MPADAGGAGGASEFQDAITDAFRTAEPILSGGAERYSAEHIMQFFAFEHLQGALQDTSRPFALLAEHIMDTHDRNPERTVALRKLLEAKDAAVRSRLQRREP